MAECSHLEKFSRMDRDPVDPSGPGCKECLASKGEWVSLRLCMDCGHVGCCDSSPGRHATAHFQQSGHPVMKAFEPGMNWAWCYPHERMQEEIPAFPQESPSHHLEMPQA